MCEHFKVLPTDERFRALTDLQVGALFSNWLYSLPEDELWRAYWTERKRKEKPKMSAEELKDIGYSESEIQAILKELGQ